MQIVIDRATLLDLVHDRWFDLTEHRFDQEQREFQLPFGDRDQGPYDKLLTVTDVRDVIIHDTEKIQIYDINKIEIEPGIVHIVCSIPLKMVLTVGPEAVLRVTDFRQTTQRLSKFRRTQGDRTCGRH